VVGDTATVTCETGDALGCGIELLCELAEPAEASSTSSPQFLARWRLVQTRGSAVWLDDVNACRCGNRLVTYLPAEPRATVSALVALGGPSLEVLAVRAALVEPGLAVEAALQVPTQLHTLYLQRCGLESFSAALLQRLTRLQTLDLSWNSIVTFSPLALAHLTASLTSLNLAHNRLTSITGLLASYTPYSSELASAPLRTVDFSFNFLTQLQAEDLPQLGSLRLLNLEHNLIDVVANGVLESALALLGDDDRTFLRMEGNPSRCKVALDNHPLLPMDAIFCNCSRVGAFDVPFCPPEAVVQCRSGSSKAVPWQSICDGQWDCEQGEDERGCQASIRMVDPQLQCFPVQNACGQRCLDVLTVQVERGIVRGWPSQPCHKSVEPVKEYHCRNLTLLPLSTSEAMGAFGKTSATLFVQGKGTGMPSWSARVGPRHLILLVLLQWAWL
jgi:hypothetical protein